MVRINGLAQRGPIVLLVLLLLFCSFAFGKTLPLKTTITAEKISFQPPSATCRANADYWSPKGAFALKQFVSSNDPWTFPQDCKPVNNFAEMLGKTGNFLREFIPDSLKNGTASYQTFLHFSKLLILATRYCYDCDAADNGSHNNSIHRREAIFSFYTAKAEGCSSNLPLLITVPLRAAAPHYPVALFEKGRSGYRFIDISWANAWGGMDVAFCQAGARNSPDSPVQWYLISGSLPAGYAHIITLHKLQDGKLQKVGQIASCGCRKNDAACDTSCLRQSQKEGSKIMQPGSANFFSQPYSEESLIRFFKKDSAKSVK